MMSWDARASLHRRLVPRCSDNNSSSDKKENGSTSGHLNGHRDVFIGDARHNNGDNIGLWGALYSDWMPRDRGDGVEGTDSRRRNITASSKKAQ